MTFNCLSWICIVRSVCLLAMINLFLLQPYFTERKHLQTVTQSPPYLNADGSAMMPVPILPFIRCINACVLLHTTTTNVNKDKRRQQQATRKKDRQGQLTAVTMTDKDNWQQWRWQTRTTDKDNWQQWQWQTRTTQTRTTDKDNWQQWQW